MLRTYICVLILDNFLTDEVKTRNNTNTIILNNAENIMGGTRERCGIFKGNE